VLDSDVAKSVIKAPLDGKPAEDASESDIALGKRFFNYKTLISFAIAFGLLYLLMRNVHMDIGATFATIRRANLGLYAIGFVIYYAGFVARGWRWQRMLANAGGAESEGKHPASVMRLAQIIYVSWFANCLVPAKLGDVIRGYMLKRDVSVRFMKGMGTILAERVLDLAVLLALLAVSGIVTMREMLPPEVSSALELGFALVGLAALGLLLLRHLDSLVRRFLPERFRERYARFHEGIMGSFRSLPFILGLTLLIWLSEAARLIFVSWSLGVHVADNPSTEVLMLVFIALASAALTALPVTPGGLGLVEVLIVNAFAWSAAASGAHIANEVAWSVAILDRSISYGSIVLLGFVVYLISRRR